MIQTLMDYIDNEHVINEIEKHPCLYETTCEEYKNRNSKLEAWVSVSKGVMGDAWETMTNGDKYKIGKEIQKRWRSLRDAFLRSLKCQDRKLGSPVNSKPYVYQRQMSFLIPTLQFRQSFGSKVETDHSASEENEKEIYHRPISSTALIQRPGPSRKRKLEEAHDKFHGKSLERTLFDILEKKHSDDTVVENNPDKLFLLSILPRVMELNTSDKLDFQIKVMQLLKHYKDAAESKPKSPKTEENL